MHTCHLLQPLTLQRPGLVEPPFPGNQDNCKSLSAVEALMCGGVVAWSMKMQLCIALSMTEAELYAISTGICQVLYMQKLFPPLSLPVDQPV